MKKSKYEIGIWGQFGDGGQIADGQAVRTTIITNEIINRYGKRNVKILNTNGWLKNPITFFLKSVFLIARSKKIIIFPADNGFKIFVPILCMINLFFNHELYYVVIGGFLPSLLQEKPVYIRLVKKFKAIFVQTKRIKEQLESFGINNIYILSNLKNLERIDAKDLKINTDRQLKVCTFSRVTYTKGIEDAIEGVKIANIKLGDSLIKLDIYGIIDRKYEQKFNDLLSRNSDFVTYKGVINYNDTVSTLKNYFALIFPTFYHGEGLAGNIIDAFHSGLPIIATDWLYNSDVIKNYKNGLLVPIKEPKKIADALLLLYKESIPVMN
jgi:glycosyltransferase involved in cell wall biosynthesis